MRATVIGGGIGGPVAAMALRKAGIEATVHERYDRTADGSGGALSIAPNGLQALDVVGLADAVGEVGAPMTAMALQSWTGRTLGRFGSEPPQLLVWRYDLYRVLRDEALRRGVTIEHGKELVGAVDHGSHVTAHFSDGSEVDSDLLIGADGIRSTVRKILDPNAPGPRYTGLLGFGARLAHTDEPSTDGEMRLVSGKRAFFGYQVRDDGSAGWFANLPRRTPMTIAEARATAPEQWLDVLTDAFAPDRTPAVRVITATDPAELVITGALEDVPRVPTWSKGRMVLLGDAAHATSPSSGQGASLAFESAVQLARCLRDLPHPEAFRTYENLRRTRVERITAQAARTNRNKAAGPIGRVLRDALMPVAMKFVDPAKFTWQFDHRIEWEDTLSTV
ncbi:2-polyprenyl-6-methoxyphenol hydroxylase-like FAD-dependent oxidoreductase [Saccharothrix ecbatanensis]|uniref:2-polyprenyl-6-methoxyphenol hydroxylase-like FAD-dependent oxidoreductase n=1 Tax=Saccharothrix ecbatanensis TaxID=1105145 RepID=A0A7W9LZH0_9PSEU|nr:NAD(P)/FAD-dependent oxidoreductase [Saccharothrix ecbatanensis]MBB5801703.1 2-polyprenyl-6-methoxyphenol hydroxylase-like FAD-dependent oxidoreductase [Saccharothrix ecbatanensis]